ncbi:MAG: phosphatase PAP2 family protein [Candidatus Lokiarchaeota archaeon]|nr:phosphatase PAP2 family protein [Candidatus Lokiarchaeota archaeon]
MKKSKHLYFLLAGLIVFIISSLGLFDGISAEISKILYHTFGYTNKWSRSYGPSWFVNMNSNVSSFGSKEVVLIFTAMFFVYLVLKKRTKDAIKFIIIILSGILVILTMKYLTSDKDSFMITKLYTDTLSSYPSGHTFIATVLYLTIALFLTENSKSKSLYYFYFGSAVMIIILVGISRVTGSGHTLTEVIAAWSSGLVLFSICALLFKQEGKTISNK